MGLYISRCCLNICPNLCRKRWCCLAYSTFYFCKLRCRQNFVFDKCLNATYPAMHCLRGFFHGQVLFVSRMISQLYYNLALLSFDNHFPQLQVRLGNKPRPPFLCILELQHYTDQFLILMWCWHLVKNQLCQRQKMCLMIKISHLKKSQIYCHQNWCLICC